MKAGKMIIIFKNLVVMKAGRMIKIFQKVGGFEGWKDDHNLSKSKYL